MQKPSETAKMIFDISEAGIFTSEASKNAGPGGGMVDAVDSKSAVSNGVRVQVPPGVQIFDW